jgi:P-type E1-E2 ATPase
VVKAATEQGLELLPATDFESVTGAGAVGCIDGKRLHVGKPDAQTRSAYGMDKALTEIKTDATDKADKTGTIDTTEKPTEDSALSHSDILIRESTLDQMALDFLRLEEQGKTAVMVTEDGNPIGVLGIADRIRTDAYAAVDTLKKANVRTLMLTGDNPRTAAFVAQKLNLDGFEASLSPSDKESTVAELSTQGCVCMVGDGINDAPSLARADVGIAIGAGTEIAIDCADVVLSGEALTGMANAYLLSRASMRIIKQNLFWALFYNAICIPVAAGLFYPLLQ